MKVKVDYFEKISKINKPSWSDPGNKQTND